jgi:Transposase DDE domain
MPYKRPLRCRQAFRIKSKSGKPQANRFFHILQTGLVLLTVAFKAKMETKEARAIYRQRSQIAEFPHGWIKERCGLRQFRCRGRVKASVVATWACLSYNIIRWVSIQRKLNGASLAAA